MTDKLKETLRSAERRGGRASVARQIENWIADYHALDGVPDAKGRSVTYHFCPTCGSTLYWVVEGDNPVLAMAVGNFVDPGFRPPDMELHADHRHDWVPTFPGAVTIDPSGT